MSRKPRPLPKGDSLFTPGASPTRRIVENRSAMPLLWLRQLPVWLAPSLLAVLLITGLAVRGPGGAAALLAVAALLTWLAAVSWLRLAAGGRLLRAAAIAVVIAVAAIQFTR